MSAGIAWRATSKLCEMYGFESHRVRQDHTVEATKNSLSFRKSMGLVT